MQNSFYCVISCIPQWCSINEFQRLISACINCSCTGRVISSDQLAKSFQFTLTRFSLPFHKEMCRRALFLCPTWYFTGVSPSLLSVIPALQLIIWIRWGVHQWLWKRYLVWNRPFGGLYRSEIYYLLFLIPNYVAKFFSDCQFCS